MELIQGFMQQPKVQTAEETIPTLCDRVENSTLIGDRRSAVLGLKAFSRQYRESVVASGLKPLLNTLKRDHIDDDMVRAILETLLILFIRGDGDQDLTRDWISRQSRLQNGKYPSPLVMKQEDESVDQFSLWIADALIQSNELIHLIIGFLETENFHIRLYAIQILEAILSTRPDRARNAITSLPTSISTIVSLLDDIHEPVRDESILLLMTIVNDSPHVQKLVAFENIFERLFAIIEEEGSLRGSLVVNDCLSLINNILNYNTSNQTLFLETGNLPKLAHILNQPLTRDEDSVSEDFFWNDQRIINMNTCLDIVSLTVEQGNSVTKKHQDTLLNSNILMIVLRLAFYHNIPKKVRPIALFTAADMIRNNDVCQIEFGKIDVPYFDPSLNSSNVIENVPSIQVINVLVNWILYANSIYTFDIRMASLELVKAYFSKNYELQKQFIEQQIAGYNSTFNEDSQDDTNDEVVQETNTNGIVPEDTGDNRNSMGEKINYNILEILLSFDMDLGLNPYKLYFSTDILTFLFTDIEENTGKDEQKISIAEIVRTMKVGSHIDDEEPLSVIGTIGELLLTSLTGGHIRIPISYITFLITWLYGNFAAVDDFLSTSTTVHSLLAFCYQINEEDITIKCLVSMLLGVAYEFSSKKSPIAREDYYEFLTRRLGQDNYQSRIRQFKENSLFSRNNVQFDIFNPPLDDTGLPKLYFTLYFVNLFNDNYYRIRTALSHSPKEESYQSITFESFEELQGKCTDLKEELTKANQDNEKTITDMKNQLNALNDTHSETSGEYEKLKNDYSNVKERFTTIESQLDKTTKKFEQLTNEKENLEKIKLENNSQIEDNQVTIEELKGKMEKLNENLVDIASKKSKAEEGINKMSKELFQLTKEKKTLEDQLKKNEKNFTKQIGDLSKKQALLEKTMSEKESIIISLNNNVSSMEGVLKKLETEKSDTEKQVEEWKRKFNSHDILVVKLTDKLKSLASNYKEIQADRENLQKKIGEIESEFTAKFQKVQTSLDNKEKENQSIIDERDILVQQLSELENEYEEAKQTDADELEKLSIEKESLTSKMVNLKSSIEDLKSKLTSSSQNNTDLQNEKTNLQAQLKDEYTLKDQVSLDIKQKDAEIEKLREGISKQNSEHSSLQKLNNDLHKEFDLVKEQIVKKNIEIQKQLKKIDGLQNLLSNNQENIKSKELALAALRTSLESDTAKYKTTITNLEESLKSTSLSQDLFKKRIENEKQELQSQVDTLSGEKGELETSRNELIAQISDMKDKLTDMQTKSDFKNEQNQDKLKEVRLKLEQAQKDIDNANIKAVEEKEKTGKYANELQQELKKSKLKISNLESEISSLKEELTKNVEDLKEKLQQSEIHITELETNLENQKDESSKQLTESSQNILSLEKEKKKLIRDLSEEKEKLVEQTKSSERTLKDSTLEMQQSIDRLTTKNASLVKEIQQTQKEFEKSQNSINEINLANSKLQDKNISKLAERQKEITALNAKVDAQIKKAMDDQIKFKTNLEELQEKLLVAEGTLERKDSEVSNLTTKLDDVETKYQDSTREKNEMIEKIEKANILIREQKEQLQSLNSNIQSLTINSEKFQKELQKVKDASSKAALQHTKELDKLKQELRLKTEEFDKERKLLNEGSSTITQEYSFKVTELENELLKISNDSTEREKITDQLRSELEISKNEHKSELQTVKSSLDETNLTLETSSVKLREAETKLESIKKESKIKTDKLQDTLKLTQGKLMNKDVTIKELKKSNLELTQVSLDASSARTVEIEALQVQLQNKESEILETKMKNEERIEETQNTIKTLNKKLKETQSNLTTTTNTLSEMEKSGSEESKILSEKLKSADKQILEIREKLKTADEEVNAIKKSTKEKSQKDSGKILEMSKTIDDLNGNLSSKLKIVAGLELQKENSEKKHVEAISALNDKFTNLENDFKKKTIEYGNVAAGDKKQIVDLLSSNEELESTSQQLRTEVENLHKDVEKATELSKSNIEKDNIIIDLKKKLSEKDTKLAEEKVSNKNLCTEMESLQKNNDKLKIIQEQLESSSQNISRLQKENDKLKATDKFSNELKSKVDTLESENSTLTKYKSETETIKIDFSELKKKSENSENELKVLKEKLSKLNGQLEDSKFLQKQNNALQDSIKEMETTQSEVLKFKENYLECNKKVSKLEMENKDLLKGQTQSIESAKTISKLESEKKGFVSEISTLTNNVSTMKTKIEEQAAEIKNFESTLKTNKNSQKTDIEKLQERVKLLEAENITLKEKESDKSEMDELMLLVTELDEKNTKYKERLENLGQEISSDEDDESDEE